MLQRKTSNISAQNLTAGFAGKRNMPGRVARVKRWARGGVAAAIIGASAIGIQQFHKADVARLEASPPAIKEIARLDFNNGYKPRLYQISEASSILREHWKEYRRDGPAKVLERLRAARNKEVRGSAEYDSLTREIWAIERFSEFPPVEQKKAWDYLGIK